MNDLHLMSCGSNCTAIGALGPNRIKGPADNIQLVDHYDDLAIKVLFENTYIDELTTLKPTIEPRIAKFPKDSTFLYKYHHFNIVHNNPLENKYVVEAKKRMDIFNDFLSHIQEPNYYFVYFIGKNEVNIAKKRFNLSKRDPKVQKLFLDKIDYFRDLGILDKVIFCGTRLVKKHTIYDFHIDDASSYPIKYIEILDHGYSQAVIDQFQAKVQKAIT